MFHYSITLYSRHHSSQMAHAVIQRHSRALCARFKLNVQAVPLTVWVMEYKGDSPVPIYRLAA